jgi:hypothetical protein
MRLLRFLVPRFDELSLFLMSAAFLFLYVANWQLPTESYIHVFSSLHPLVLALVLLFATGMGFSVYHAFTLRRKTDLEKLMMLFFGIAANYFGALAAGIHVWRHAAWWLAVFPLWNALDGAVLVLKAGVGVIDERYVADADVTWPHLLVGLGFLTVLLAVCQYALELYWGLTFSICIGYASSASRSFRRLFGFAASWRRFR